jgi:hypothetical protein
MSAEAKPVGRSKHSKFITPGKVILGLLILIPAALLGYRTYELLSTPNIGEPFDVAAFTSYTLPEERNAYVHFWKATALLVPSSKVLGAVDPTKFSQSEGKAEEGWEDAIPEVRTWVTANGATLKELQQGAAQSECLQFPPAEAVNSFPRVDWGSLRECARLEALDGSRLITEGRVTEAWNCYRTLLRMGRLLDMRTDLIGSMSASAIGEMGISGGVAWSANKKLTSEDLKHALRDALLAEELKTPPSDTIKLEYFVVREFATKGVIYGSSIEPWVRYTGYPAQVGRSARLVVANLLSQADRPGYLRTPVHPGTLGLFELDPTSPPTSNLRPPEEVERSAITSAPTVAKAVRRVAPEAASLIEVNDPHMLMSNLYAAYQTEDFFQTRRAGLILALALQLHYREHGEFPAALNELVHNGYLKSIPIDPFGKGEPFRYRRESGPQGAAVVWSVWIDGIDQGGPDLHPGSDDWGLRVVAPGTRPAPGK